MRVGKRERLALRQAKIEAQARAMRIARDGAPVKGLRSSCDFTMPVGTPSRSWGWDFRSHLSAVHTKGESIIHARLT